jgi:hypothetical protein
MKLTTRAILFSIVCLVVLTVAITSNFGQPIVTVAGVYENFTVGKGSGDLEGMRVGIVSAGGGYYAHARRHRVCGWWLLCDSADRAGRRGRS